MAIRWKEYFGRPIQVTDKERSRADKGWTIVVRPQPSGLIMVAAINVKTGKPLGPKVPFVNDRSEIQEAAQQELRMLSKMGLGGEMADASRFRLSQELSKQWGSSVKEAAKAPEDIAIKVNLDELGNFWWGVLSKLPVSGGHYRIFAQGAAPTPEAAFDRAHSAAKRIAGWW